MIPMMTKQARQKGQSVLELSLITPLLLVALYIPADFGVAFFMGNITQNAAREGARIGSWLSKSGSPPNLVFDKKQADIVKAAVFDRLPDYLTNKAVRVKFYQGTDCMEFIEVTAQGDYSFFLYQLMRMFGSTVDPTAPISRTTQIRYNYQQYKNNDYCTGSITFNYNGSDHEGA